MEPLSWGGVVSPELMDSLQADIMNSNNLQIFHTYAYVDIGMHHFFKREGEYYLLCSYFPHFTNGDTFLIKSDTIENLIEAVSNGAILENINCTLLNFEMSDDIANAIEDGIIKDQNLILLHDISNKIISGFAGVPCLPTYNCEYNVFMKIKN